MTCWTPDQPIRAEDAARLPSAITEAEDATRPIDGKALAVLLVQTLKIWKLPDDWDDIAPFYREALEDVPPDLVQASLKHLRLTLKWFPKPAELRAPIALELDRRRSVLRRLRSMAMKARLGDVEPPALRIAPTPEEQAAANEIADKARLLLAATEIKRVPAAEVDDDEAKDRNRRRRVSLREAYETLRADGIDPDAWRKGTAKDDRPGSGAGTDALEADG